MPQPSKLHRVILAIFLAVLTGSSVSAVTAQTSDGIVITLPADLDPEQRDALVDALDRLQEPVQVAAGSSDGTVSDDATVGDLAMVLGRFDDAILAADQVPGLLSAWWVGLSGAGGLASLLAVLAGLLALAVGLGLEYGVDRAVGGWRAACLSAQSTRFSTKMGFAFGWFGLEILGLVVFGVGALVAGWLILPATPIARLSLAVVVVAVLRARLLLALGHLIFAPKAANLRMIPMSDADARMIYRWILVLALVAALAFGSRDVLVGVGASLEAAAFLGILAAAVALAARLVAFMRTRRPIRDLIRRSYARDDGSTPKLAEWFADGWHLLFGLLAVMAFVGRLYAELAGGGGALASVSLGPVLILALLPMMLGGYGALIDDLVIEPATNTRQAVIGDVLKTLGRGAFLLIAFVFLASTWNASPFAGADAGIG
ncbi:MAG: hypothetical protein AAF637_14295, partial [Pseudomonadota bacterium]